MCSVPAPIMVTSKGSSVVAMAVSDTLSYWSVLWNEFCREGGVLNPQGLMHARVRRQSGRADRIPTGLDSQLGWKISE